MLRLMLLANFALPSMLICAEGYLKTKARLKFKGPSFVAGLPSTMQLKKAFWCL